MAEIGSFRFSEVRSVRTQGARISVATAGDGPALLLLHGYPQTHRMWERIAPALARDYTLVAPDLRGYGASEKPASTADHSTYSKRAMAADMAEVMTLLGYDRFAVCGHDRGARVAHRMALDWAERIDRVAFLDIVPTLYRFEHLNLEMAKKAYHWFFLIQKSPLPETLIGANPAYFLKTTLNSWAAREDFWEERAFDSYLSNLQTHEGRLATCEDYRASASIDLEHDRADRGRRIECPTLVLWGERSPQGSSYDMLGVWRDYVTDLRGEAIISGHFLAEEAPELTASALLAFLREARGQPARMVTRRGGELAPT